MAKTSLVHDGAGFKDKDKALETIKLLEGRDISFQFQVINSMYHRAKVILKRTKDAEKVQNLTEAIETFQVWLDDYRAHSRAKENFTYLPLETVEAYERLAEKYGVSQAVNSRPSFLQVYKAAEGELKKLRMAKVDPDDEQTVTWDVHRNKHLREISERIKSDHLPLYETDVEFRGLPTKEHVELIMWGYSSEPTKVKKCVSLIDEKLGVTNEDSEKLVMTNGGSEKLSVASEGSEKLDTSDEEMWSSTPPTVSDASGVTSPPPALATTLPLEPYLCLFFFPLSPLIHQPSETAIAYLRNKEEDRTESTVRVDNEKVTGPTVRL
uniref:Uncharacterized protein n=1 Tax=Timema douglasi TaxID=61478 RepID=A0A7R8VD26_TIMDO|nr:unnamed protein product [Timema douglasi]